METANLIFNFVISLTYNRNYAIIDVSYKTYEERVLAVLPIFAESEKFSVKKLCEAVGIDQPILRDGLKREGLKFSDFKDNLQLKNCC